MNSKFLVIALAFVVPAKAQHTNIMISNSLQPEEPSIMISSKNVKYAVAGANISSAYYSSDTGRTWTRQQLTSSFGVYGDPAIICDTAGSFYFFHLSNTPGGNFIDRMVCQKSINNGVTWDNGSSFGLNGTKGQDKQWAVVDRNTNTIYTTWTQFDKYGSTNPADISIILFSKSIDNGATWSSPVRINEKAGDCVDEDNTVEGAVPAVGPNGEIYTAWAGPDGLVFDKSTDGGTTWMATDKIITTIPGGWDYSIPGISRANGLPVTVCDLSNGPGRGTIYINWTDQRNGTNDTDVWLVKSTDGGTTWSAPVKVNNDAPGKQQFFTWMNIDQKNGYLYFVFYDRRNYTDNQTDVYMARSADGGSTFQNFKISQSPFVPVPNIFFGDYTNLSVQSGVIRPVWTRMENGILSIWTALIDTAAIPGVITGINSPDIQVENFTAYPNPFTNNSFVSFKLRRPSRVSLSIYDMNGRLISKPIESKWYAAGKYVEKVDSRLSHISPGSYYYTITENGKFYTRKTIRVE
jgi:Secretion system C-terminal sorting domain